MMYGKKPKKNKVEDRLMAHHCKNQQLIQGVAENKCVLAWLDDRWPEQVDSSVHLE